MQAKMAIDQKLAADGVALASGIGAGTSILAQVDLIVSILAGIAAIIAAGVSVYMHCTRRKRSKGKDDSNN